MTNALLISCCFECIAVYFRGSDEVKGLVPAEGHVARQGVIGLLPIAFIVGPSVRLVLVLVDI